MSTTVESPPVIYGATNDWAPSDLDLLDAEAVWIWFENRQYAYEIVEIEPEGLS